MTDRERREPQEPLWITYEQAQSRSTAANCAASGVRRACATRGCCARRRRVHQQVALRTGAFGGACGSLRVRARQNHAFDDGNKRIAFMAMMTFLLKNGVAFNPEPAQSTTIILAPAAGEVSEESLTRWIRDNWPSE
jgi:death on curing protein